MIVRNKKQVKNNYEFLENGTWEKVIKLAYMKIDVRDIKIFYIFRSFLA